MPESEKWRPSLGKEQSFLPGHIPLAQYREAAAKIQKTIGIHRDPDALFRVLAKELRSIVRAHTIGIVHYDDFEEAVQWFALDMDGVASPFFPLVPWEGSASRRVYEHQLPLLVDLTSDNSPYASSFDFLAQFGVLSVCVLPMTTRQRRLGVDRYQLR